MTTFATARLRARPVTVDDLPVFERLWGDERVGRTLGGVRDRAQVEQTLVEASEHWRRWGFGRWLLEDGERPVGTVKLAHCRIDGRPEVELGYALLPGCWGAGYATEGSAGALQHARDVVGLPEVVAFALVSNAASLAVMRRLGFRHERYLARPAGTHELRRLVLPPSRDHGVEELGREEAVGLEQRSLGLRGRGWTAVRPSREAAPGAGPSGRRRPPPPPVVP